MVAGLAQWGRGWQAVAGTGHVVCSSRGLHEQWHKSWCMGSGHMVSCEHMHHHTSRVCGAGALARARGLGLGAQGVLLGLAQAATATPGHSTAQPGPCTL